MAVAKWDITVNRGKRKRDWIKPIDIMTDDGLEQFKATTMNSMEETANDRAKAVKFLHGTGLYDKHGELKEEFR